MFKGCEFYKWMKFKMEDILKPLQEALNARLGEMKDEESAYLVFREEFLKKSYITEKILKKIFDSAYKLANNDFKALIAILIELLDLLSVFKESNEIFKYEKPSKLRVAVDLLKENIYNSNGSVDASKVEDFVSLMDKKLLISLYDIVTEALKEWDL